MTTEEQLANWLEGKSIHNDERGECCPDFSCCNLELLASEEERKLFVSRPAEREKMLYMFLGRAMASYKPKKKVHIAGDEANYRREA